MYAPLLHCSSMMLLSSRAHYDFTRDVLFFLIKFIFAVPICMQNELISFNHRKPD